MCLGAVNLSQKEREMISNRPERRATEGRERCVIEERERQMSFILPCVTLFDLSSPDGK